MARTDFENHGMEYNTEKGNLIFPEYGRNIQSMILLAKAERDLDKRQMMIESIVSLMYQMNPQSKNVDDYKEKLWKHVFRTADYNLGGVLPPSGIHPEPEDIIKKPERINYPPSGARFRHYGNNVHQLIKKAQSMEDGYVKEGMVGTIGAYMKLAYKTWNKEHYVSDEIIKSDLATLSGGTLMLEEGRKIDQLAVANKRRKPEEINTGRNNSNNNDNRNSGGGNRNSNDNRNSGGGPRNSNNNNNRNDSRDNRNNDNRNSGGGPRNNDNRNSGGPRNNDMRNNNNNNRNNNNNDNRGGRR